MSNSITFLDVSPFSLKKKKEKRKGKEEREKNGIISGGWRVDKAFRSGDLFWETISCG